MKSIFLSSLLAIFLAACSYKTSTNINLDNYAYIKFPYSKVYDVSINGNASVQIQGGKNSLYEVKSGKNHIVVYENGVLVFDKEIYIGNQNTYEIKPSSNLP